jgi:hypothetical protein
VTDAGPATYTAIDLHKPGPKTLDDADNGVVRIERRGTGDPPVEQAAPDGSSAATRNGQPQSLEDLVRDHDAAKVKSLTQDFLKGTPLGREQL